MQNISFNFTRRVSRRDGEEQRVEEGRGNAAIDFIIIRHLFGSSNIIVR